MEPTIYLFFQGNCLEAMTHYAETLGGEIGGVFRNADVPNAESRMPGGDHLVMNMTMRLGASTVMASDAPDEMYRKPQGFTVSISPPSRRSSPPAIASWLGAQTPGVRCRLPVRSTRWSSTRSRSRSRDSPRPSSTITRSATGSSRCAR